jgi:hypothetical protein
MMSNPGVYLNHDMIALSGYGDLIASGPNVSEAGFGGAALPPGASATPTDNFNTANVPQQPQQQAPAPQQAPQQQAPAPQQAPQQQAPAPQQAPQQPHQQILTPPTPPKA